MSSQRVDHILLHASSLSGRKGGTFLQRISACTSGGFPRPPDTFLGWNVPAPGYLGTARYFHQMWAAEQGQTPDPPASRAGTGPGNQSCETK